MLDGVIWTQLWAVKMLCPLCLARYNVHQANEDPSPVQHHILTSRKTLGAHAVQHRQAGSALLFQCTYVFLKTLCNKRDALCIGPVQLQAVLRT